MSWPKPTFAVSLKHLFWNLTDLHMREGDRAGKLGATDDLRVRLYHVFNRRGPTNDIVGALRFMLGLS